jgi:hypothetical protein
MRGSISTCETFAPRRAKHCVSSEPIGPPPSTTSRRGSLRISHTVSEVSGRASASPGIGGTNGRAPAAITIAFVVNVRLRPSSPVTSTSHGDTMRAAPCTHSTPSAV